MRFSIFSECENYERTFPTQINEVKEKVMVLEENLNEQKASLRNRLTTIANGLTCITDD